MFGYIYKTTDTINNKLYIGKHKGLFDYNYFGSGIYLKKAINKYGRDKFKLELVVYAEDKNKLDLLEKNYIAEYRQIFGKDKLYNIAKGGDGGCCFLPGELNPSKRIEVRKKISKAKKGIIPSAEHIRKIGIDRSNRIWINKNNKTKFVKPQNLQNFISAGWKIGRLIDWKFNHPITESIKQKIRSTLKNRIKQGLWFNQYTERR